MVSLLGLSPQIECAVHVVHADAVDPQPGQPGGDALGLLVRGEAGVEAEVGGPEADRPGVGGQMAVAALHEAVLARRAIEPRGDVGHVVRRVVGDHKGKERLLGQGDAGTSERQQRGKGGPQLVHRVSDFRSTHRSYPVVLGWSHGIGQQVCRNFQ